jgi:hypothetical protein
MAFLLRLVFGIVIIAIVVALLLTWHTNTSPTEQVFANGKIPTEKLEGFYRGAVDAPIKVTWSGKKFAVGSTTGINLFEDGLGSTTEKYPFTYAESPALREPGIKVIAIDYDLPENPFWVRPILDELVQISTSTYLGKMNIRVIPGYPFAITYFRLEK